MTTQNPNTNRDVLRSRLSPVCIVGMTAIGIFMMSNAASAQVTLFDDLANSVDGTGPVNSPGPSALSFSTGTTPVSLTDVKLVLSGTGAAGTTTVDLLSDNMTAPGSLLTPIGMVSDGSLPATPTVVDFPLTTPFALASDTRYWLELTDTSTAAQLSYTYTNSGVGVPNEYYYTTGTVYPNSQGPDLAQVTGVPEPGAYALLASLGITGAAFLRRRSRAK